MVFAELRSRPSASRSAPSASLTTAGLVGAEEHQVAVGGAHALEHAVDRGFGQELQDRRLQAVAALGALVDLDVGETFRAVAADERRVVVDFLARELAALRQLNAAMRLFGSAAGRRTP